MYMDTAVEPALALIRCELLIIKAELFFLHVHEFKTREPRGIHQISPSAAGYELRVTGRILPSEKLSGYLAGFHVYICLNSIRQGRLTDAGRSGQQRSLSFQIFSDFFKTAASLER